LFANLPLFNKIISAAALQIYNPVQPTYICRQPCLHLCSVRGTSGLRYGVEYNSRNIEELYNNFKTELERHMVSASIPVKTDEDEWRTALNGQGVYFDYGTSDTP
jgi:hypothetical protein